MTRTIIKPPPPPVPNGTRPEIVPVDAGRRLARPPALSTSLFERCDRADEGAVFVSNELLYLRRDLRSARMTNADHVANPRRVDRLRVAFEDRQERVRVRHRFSAVLCEQRVGCDARDSTRELRQRVQHR